MSGILVIAEQRRGELRPVSLELVSAAAGFAAAEGAAGAAVPSVTVAILAQDPAAFVPALSVAGVDEIVTVAVAAREFDPDSFESALGALIDARRPELVLIAHSVDSFGYAAALAAARGCGFATDVFKFERSDGALVATRGGYGQKVHVEVDFPGRATVLLALRANTWKPPDTPATSRPAAPQPAAPDPAAPDPAAPDPAGPLVTSFAVPAAPCRTIGGEFVEVAAADDVDMTSAEFILSIGRGVGDEAKIAEFRALADAVGATLGCSRPLADAGWLPKSRQVGQSGKTASACKLYIAMGVSGAIQHLAGMKHVSTIVAVNSDAEASIFGVAKYGIVGDIFEIAAELRRHF
jgi:electron transfer flavoprotein alpha subunit